MEGGAQHMSRGWWLAAGLSLDLTAILPVRYIELVLSLGDMLSVHTVFAVMGSHLLIGRIYLCCTLTEREEKVMGDLYFHRLVTARKQKTQERRHLILTEREHQFYSHTDYGESATHPAFPASPMRCHCVPKERQKLAYESNSLDALDCSAGFATSPFHQLLLAAR